MNEVKSALRTWMTVTILFIAFTGVLVAGALSYRMLQFEKQNQDSARELLKSDLAKDYSSIAEQVYLSLESIGPHEKQLQGLMGRSANVKLTLDRDLKLSPDIQPSGRPIDLMKWSGDAVNGNDALIVPLFFGDVYVGALKVQLDWQTNMNSRPIVFTVIGVIAFILLSWLVVSFIMRRSITNIIIKRVVELQKNEAVAEMASLVAHDIRSPLKNLESMLPDLKPFLSEDCVLVISSSISEMWDITEELLKKQRELAEASNADSDTMDAILASPIISKVIYEKREAFKSKGITIQGYKEISAEFQFIEAKGSSLSRVLSNLIDNSCESIKHTNGEIKVSLRRSLVKENCLEIEITDNGCGISEENLKRLGEKRFTDGKKNGNGLGIHYTKEFVKSLGGEFLAQSKLGVGTSIKLTIPAVEPPKWFTNQVTIVGNERKLVILDDDQSTHNLWKTRFSTPPYNLTHLKEFNDGDFQNIASDNGVFFLIDEQLTNDGLKGHQIINRFNLSERAILVTSQYADVELQNHAVKSGFKILPKDLIKHCAIVEGATPPIATPQKSPDLVLVDDHRITGLVWTIKAKEKKKNVAVFESPDAFLKTDIPKSTPIYVDLRFNGKLIGIDLLRELNSKGFVDLHVTTSNRQGVEIPKFVRSVQGKEFPA